MSQAASPAPNVHSSRWYYCHREQLPARSGRGSACRRPERGPHEESRRWAGPLSQIAHVSSYADERVRWLGATGIPVPDDWTWYLGVGNVLTSWAPEGGAGF